MFKTQGNTSVSQKQENETDREEEKIRKGERVVPFHPSVDDGAEVESLKAWVGPDTHTPNPQHFITFPCRPKNSALPQPSQRLAQKGTQSLLEQ